MGSSSRRRVSFHSCWLPSASPAVPVPTDPPLPGDDPGPHRYQRLAPEAKTRGGAAEGEGRVRLGAAAASSPRPRRGLSHRPPPWVGGTGVAGVRTPGFPEAAGRERGEGPGGSERRVRGDGQERGAGRGAPRVAGGSEAPPRPRPAPPPLPIVLRQSGRRRPPRPPKVSVSVPPSAPSLSLRPPSGLWIRWARPVLLSLPRPGRRARRTPAPGPAACELPEGLRTGGLSARSGLTAAGRDLG